MELKDRTVLVLGGTGLVGSAVARQMVGHTPKKLILTSLHKREAEEEARELEDVSERPGDEILANFGNGTLARVLGVYGSVGDPLGHPSEPTRGTKAHFRRRSATYPFPVRV